MPGTAPTQSGEHARIDHSRAVKKYHRPAAGLEAPLPEDVRPAPVLRRTMDYLLDSILDKSTSAFSDKHKFVRDRTRSIRQDIIVQQRAIHRDPQSLLIIVRLHEEIARFHILSGHRLCECGFSEFDPFQNTEQLRKVLQSLQEYYSDIRKELAKGIKNPAYIQALQNESEFRAYQILTHAEDADVFRQALSFDKGIFGSSHVQFALRCVSAFHQVDYVKYFGMTARADYLQASLLHTHFVKLRKSALKIISRAFGSKETLPAETVARWLLIEDKQELVALVEAVGGKVIEGNGDMSISLSSSSSNADTNQFDVTMSPGPLLMEPASTTPIKARMSKLIEAKVMGVPISSIVRSPPEAIFNEQTSKSDTTALLPSLYIPTKQTRAPIQPPPTPTPPPQQRDTMEIKNSMCELMASNLIEWMLVMELPQICEISLTSEAHRRQQLKARIVDRVCEMCISAITQEFCTEIIIKTIQEGCYRTKVIQQISERIAREILDEVLRRECRLITLNGSRPPTKITPSGSSSGLDSVFVTPRRIRITEHVQTPIRYCDD